MGIKKKNVFEVVLRTVPSNRIIFSGSRSPARNIHNLDQLKKWGKTYL